MFQIDMTKEVLCGFFYFFNEFRILRSGGSILAAVISSDINLGDPPNPKNPYMGGLDFFLLLQKQSSIDISDF
jgi:hypothetical protein